MMNRRTAAKILCLAVLGSVLLLAGCATTPVVKIMPYVGVSFYPPTDPTSIMVLDADPIRPHKTLGHVIVEPEHTLSIEETHRILRDSAASIGADAVVIMANMAMKAGANPWHLSGGHLITAVAIRYTDETSRKNPGSDPRN